MMRTLRNSGMQPALVVGSVAVSLGFVAAECVFARLIHEVIVVRPSGTTIALLCAAGVVRGILLMAANSMPSLAEAGTLRELRLRHIRALLWTPKEPAAVADLRHLLTDVDATAARASSAFLGIISTSVTIAALVAGIFWLSPMRALMAMAGLVVCAFASVGLSRTGRRLAEKQLHLARQLAAGVARVASNWVMIKHYGLEAREDARMGRLVDTVARLSRKAAIIGAVGPCATAVLGILLLAALLLAENAQLFDGADAAAFVPLVYLLVRLVQTLVTLSSALSTWSRARPFAAQAMAAPAATVPARPTPEVTARTERAPPRLEMRGLSFKRAGAAANVLSGLDLTIEGGEHFALMGPSGCGKSTLINLVLALYAPTAGQMLIEGLTASDYVDRFRGTIAYVGQEPLLIAGTLAENVAFGMHTPVSADEIHRAMADAGASELLSRCPEGLNRRIEEGGYGLSAGEKQRLSLAQALLRKPSLLLLDEVSANLDARTEAGLCETLKDLKGICTIVLVTHRTGILRHFDRVFDLGSMSPCPTA